MIVVFVDMYCAYSFLAVYSYCNPVIDCCSV